MNQIPQQSRKKPQDVEVAQLDGGGVVVHIRGRLRALLAVVFGDVELILNFDDSVWLYQAIYKLVMRGRVALEWEPNVAAAIQSLEEFLKHAEPQDPDYDGTLAQDALDYLKEGRRVPR